MQDDAENVARVATPPAGQDTPAAGAMVKPNYGPILEAGAAQLEEALSTLKVEQADALVAKDAILGRALRAKDFVLKKHREESEPLKLQLAEITGRWMPWRDRFDRLIAGAKTFGSLRLAWEAKEQEAERAKREAELAAARKAAEAAPADSSPEALDALSHLRQARKQLDMLPPAGAPRVLKTETGTQYVAKTWDFEVLQEAEVPEEFTRRVVDPDKVMAAIEGGARDIRGLRIFEKESVRFRRNRGKR